MKYSIWCFFWIWHDQYIYLFSMELGMIKINKDYIIDDNSILSNFNDYSTLSICYCIVPIYIYIYVWFLILRHGLIGGFANYILGMSGLVAKQFEEGREGNNWTTIRLGWMIMYLFLVNFIGLFTMIPAAKVIYNRNQALSLPPLIVAQ